MSQNPPCRPERIILDASELLAVVPDYIPMDVLSEMLYQVFDDYLNSVKFDPTTPPSVIPTLDNRRISNSFKLTNGDGMQLQAIFKDVYVSVSRVLASTGTSLLVDENGALDYVFEELTFDRLILRRILL